MISDFYIFQYHFQLHKYMNINSLIQQILIFHQNLNFKIYYHLLFNSLFHLSYNINFLRPIKSYLDKNHCLFFLKNLE